MENRPQHGIGHDDLVTREVEFYLRKVRGHSGTAIGKSTLGRRIASSVLLRSECRRLNLELDPAQVGHGGGYVAEDPSKFIGSFWTPVDDREVQVLGEAVRFEVTLSECGPALEDPVIAQFGLRCDAGEQPSEHVVLFDDVIAKTPLCPQCEDFVLRNHDAPGSGT